MFIFWSGIRKVGFAKQVSILIYVKRSIRFENDRCCFAVPWTGFLSLELPSKGK